MLIFCLTLFLHCAFHAKIHCWIIHFWRWTEILPKSMTCVHCNSWRRSSDPNVLYCWIYNYVQSAQLTSPPTSEITAVPLISERVRTLHRYLRSICTRGSSYFRVGPNTTLARGGGGSPKYLNWGKHIFWGVHFSWQPTMLCLYLYTAPTIYGRV